MEITPGSPVMLYVILLCILFSFLLFALPRHYSFSFSLFNSTSFIERLGFLHILL